VHRLGDGSVRYYSRRGIEHAETSSYGVLDAAVLAATGAHEKIILDGELILWNKKK
jgi:ATP-dependent DNA ligase